jgi:uncharacterized protein
VNQRDLDIIRYWLERAEECLRVVVDYADDVSDLFRVNRLYHACFYAVRAWMCATERDSATYAGVKTLVNRDLVNAGLLSLDAGKLYNNLEVTRLDADYADFAQVNPDDIRAWIPRVRAFIDRMKQIIEEDGGFSL